jgi:dihydrofolate synthase/folylpolyglutamate synthase
MYGMEQRPLSTIAEADAALARYWPTKLKHHVYELEHMKQLMDFLGNPQKQLRIVHVAGTSGKTSTAYYVAAMLQAAGHKVGLTVSPHISSVNERVQLNLVPLDEVTFCADLTHFLALVAESGVTPSYFELITAFAFWKFAALQVDYAVIEVGMGGLLDATNVVQRTDKVCVITDVGLDHTRFLGATLADIATHKAGIIQLHNAVFCHVQDEVVLAAIRARCQQKQADLHILSDEPPRVALDFLPLFQQRNIALAHAAASHVLAQDDQTITPEMLLQAAHTRIPGRMEILQRGGKTIVLDGAHNAQKMQMLVRSMQHHFPGQQVAALVSSGASRAEQAVSTFQALEKLTDQVIVTSFGRKDDLHPSAPVEELLAAAQAAHVSAQGIADQHQAVQALLARPEKVLLVSGSFYMLAEVRALLLALE